MRLSVNKGIRFESCLQDGGRVIGQYNGRRHGFALVCVPKMTDTKRGWHGVAYSGIASQMLHVRAPCMLTIISMKKRNIFCQINDEFVCHQ